MKSWIRTLLLTAVAAAGQALISSPPAQADDDYWDGYWSWYDGTYQPYYHYRVSPRYSMGYPYRDGYYDSFSSGYYGPRYRYGTYYGAPRVGYREFGPPAQVQVGPIRFGWR
jgi:hypothetical protein